MPLWLFIANRPRAGKDYLAGVISILYTGELQEDAPLERGSEETRKRITAALMAGRMLMHLANCQGHINDATLIGAITARVIRVRNLGSTSADADLELQNEMEFSMSANVGVTYREDNEPRTGALLWPSTMRTPTSDRSATRISTPTSAPTVASFLALSTPYSGSGYGRGVRQGRHRSPVFRSGHRSLGASCKPMTWATLANRMRRNWSLEGISGNLP